MLALVPIIASLVPEVVKYFAGDHAGAVATKVAAAANEVFGTSDPGDIAAAMVADPAKALEFKAKLLDIQLEFAKLESEERKQVEQSRHEETLAALKDIGDARATMISLAQAHSPIAWGPVVVSCVIFIAACSLIGFLFIYTGEISGAREDLMKQYAVAILPLLTMVATFWLGSSAGSASKQDALTNLTHAVIQQNTSAAKTASEDLTAALNRQVLAKNQPTR